MQRMIFLLLVCSYFIFVVPLTAFSLSNDDYQQFLTYSSTFRKADAELGKLFQKFRTKFSKEKFRTVLLEQRKWLKQGRDLAAQQHPKYRISPVDAYTAVTEERTKALMDKYLLPPAQDPLQTPSTPQKIEVTSIKPDIEQNQKAAVSEAQQSIAPKGQTELDKKRVQTTAAEEERRLTEQREKQRQEQMRKLEVQQINATAQYQADFSRFAKIFGSGLLLLGLFYGFLYHRTHKA
jgi:hypothetical protein